MHVSIDVIAEELSREGLAVEVTRREDRRGISSVVLGANATGPGSLCVMGAGCARTTTAEHLVVVVDGIDEVMCPDARSLAVVRTGLSPELVHARICSTLVSLSNWDSRMLEAIAARQGVDAVLAIAAERLANPIALFDSKQALLAWAGELTADAEGTIWEDVLLKRYSPIEYYTRDEQDLIARMVRSGWPTTLRPLRNPGHEHLSRTIAVDGRLIGTIGQVDVNAPFSPAQVALADLVCDRLQLALSLRLGNGPGEDDTAYLLRSVLNGNKADKGLVAYHLSKLGWTGRRFSLVSCSLPSEEEDRFGNDYRLGRVARMRGDSIAIIYEARIVMLLPVEEAGNLDDLSGLLGSLDMMGAVSEPFSDIADARVAYEQCVLALEALEDAEPGTIVRFSDVFERVMPHAVDPAMDRRALCDGQVLALATRGFKGDVARGRALVRELYSYLMNGCNAHLTARELYLHRNTLVYHIEQLEGLLGCKLDELPSSRRLFLMVSCLIALEKNR